MDVAYDHIQEEILSSSTNTIRDNEKKDNADKNEGNVSNDTSGQGEKNNNDIDLSAEFQETFRAFSKSQWGMKIGGLWDNVRKQGESYYEGARQEYAAASEEAVKGFSGLRNTLVGRTRGLSLGTAFSSPSSGANAEGSEKKDDDAETVTGKENTTAESAEDGEGFLSRFRAEAAKRLKEIEKAEDAADEALLRFGTNIRNFLRDAVSIAPPEDGSKVLFESKDADGKRVYHATRFEAQLHAIHSNLESFSKDPVSDQWPAFKESFKIEAQTDDIAKDLEKYPELRRAMETLVPEQVEYASFWSRYYFLRLVVEDQEQKRKELLKGASNTNEEEEVAWDEESDSESPSTPHVNTNSSGSQQDGLKPSAPRRSNDQQSQPDSESSYDLVSGATSHTPGSPHEKPLAGNSKTDESEEEDWE